MKLTNEGFEDNRTLTLKHKIAIYIGTTAAMHGSIGKVFEAKQAFDENRFKENNKTIKIFKSRQLIIECERNSNWETTNPILPITIYIATHS